MKHAQILDKLAAKHLVSCLETEVLLAVESALVTLRYDADTNVSYHVLSALMPRWRARQDDPIFQVALVVLLHKYGIAEPDTTTSGVNAIRLLCDPPTPLNRRPKRPAPLSFYRPGDVVVFFYQGVYISAYIDGDVGVNEAPILEFYEGVFTTQPSYEQLASLRAYGVANPEDGIHLSRSRYAVFHMTYLPDLAQQITLIASGIEQGPRTDHLKPSLYAYVVSDILRLQTLLGNISQR
ncbi:hypothetical protein MADA3029_p0110 [Vibrio nigripulchritudo MADA3029]|uniref:hypothetical protein n=1 Tax=Vibrio nigripulchritudo TaxID=28173 RepID=UPI0003B1AB30|nr:hypothetical protein [Vibrio nigripulchritudo]CCN50871.1 hypothetical protein VIBNIMADA3020_p0110 [Vibrio nigripulchritudo MADA3020]CCN56729.1 hypothetical protein VIBNIMADA3021_p0110 [Vibrio nigripulchritudo MADA3021]CCN62586.1 hypothetical protein MADA3029_p0110 [Vibrio nigripulchritudo MADA3029]